jgi:chondroitin AC lyase
MGGSARIVGVVAALGVFGSAGLARAADIDTLISRLQSVYRDGTGTGSAASYLSAMQSDGCFANIDYGDTARTGWTPSKHLGRLKVLAAAYRTSGHVLFKGATTLDALRRGLDCWYAKAPTSTNWWHNEIGKQLSLGPIGVLMKGQLGANRQQQIIADLQTSVAAKFTGQNRVWIAQNVVLRGCLEGSAARVDTGLASIKSTVVISTAEGIQPDYSFHQHGPMLYNAGYGHGFISDTSRWAHLTRGTQFAFSAQQVDVLVGLLLEADRWMVRGELFDYSADGREIARPGQSAKGLIGAARRLAEVAPARALELEALATHIEGKSPAPLSGNRHFWRGDLMTHHRAGYYLSIKLASSRTYGTECINQENLKGNWLPFGLTYIARRGDEYRDIFPLWDWAHLPGVTNPATTSCPKAGYAKPSFAGGVSDGRYGVAAMELDAEKTRAKKAWFLFDGELVALGAAISSTQGQPVSTTLNQTWLRTAVVVDGSTVAKGKRSLPAVGWLHHDRVGYLLPDKPDLMVQNQQVSGSWQQINASKSGATLSGDVFAAWIAHGKAPSGTSYAYAIVPDITQSAFASYAQAPPFAIVENSAAVQAVEQRDLGLLGVVFHQAASVSAGELTLAVDGPCLLLVDRSSAAQTTIHASNPNGLDATVLLDVSRGAVSERLTLTLDGRSSRYQLVHPALVDGGAGGDGLGGDGLGGDGGLLDHGASDAYSPRDGSGGQTDGRSGALDDGCGVGGRGAPSSLPFSLALLALYGLFFRFLARLRSRR